MLTGHIITENLKDHQSGAPVATSPIAISPYATHCHRDIILVMTSFATELATPTVTDVQTYVRTPYCI